MQFNGDATLLQASFKSLQHRYLVRRRLRVVSAIQTAQRRRRDRMSQLSSADDRMDDQRPPSPIPPPEPMELNEDQPTLQPSLERRPAVSEEMAELYFLIANFLTNASPCSRAAAVLQEELVSVSVRRYRIKPRRPYSFTELPCAVRDVFDSAPSYFLPVRSKCLDKK